MRIDHVSWMSIIEYTLMKLGSVNSSYKTIKLNVPQVRNEVACIAYPI